MRDSRGFILIVVLWIIAILALISAGFSRSVQSHLRDASSASRSAKAESLADAGVNIVALDLIGVRDDRSYTRRFRVDGTPATCGLGTAGSLVVRVQDSSGLINLNLADSKLIAAALIGFGVPVERAGEYADRIVDFRDTDGDRLPSGAEKDEYLAAGVPRGAKNARFDALSELHQVLGLPPDVIAKLIPISTLHSGTAGLDVQAAPALLVTAVEDGLTHLPDIQADVQLGGALPTEFAASSLKRFYTAEVTAFVAGGGRFSRQAEFEVTIGRGSIPNIKAWARGAEAVDDAPSTDADNDPPC